MRSQHGETEQEEHASVTVRPARHTAKTKKATEGSETSGEFYPGITPEGEAKVREIARAEILEIVEKAEPGSVVIFSGTSDYVRTKSTTRVSGNEVKKVLADRQDEFVFLDEQDINALVGNEPVMGQNSEGKTGFSLNVMRKAIEGVQKVVAENPGKKIVITYPLYLTEFSMDTKNSGRQKDQKKWKTDGQAETWTPYLTAIMKRNNNNEADAVADWIRTNGKIIGLHGSTILGPKPQDVAENYKRGIERLVDTGKRLFPNRPLVIMPTAHSWDLDVYIAYMAHKGTVTEQGFREIAKGDGHEVDIIGSYEAPLINYDKKGQGTLSYRGKTYETDKMEN